jgi:aspartokinase
MPSLSRVRRHISFVEVSEGHVEAGTKSHCERSIMERLATSGIPIDAVEISGNGCSFIINSRDGGRFASAIRDLNVAVKFYAHCARVALTRAATDWPLPALKSVMEAFDAAALGIVHLTSDATSVTVVVNEGEADRVVGVLSRFCRPAAISATHSIAS